MCEVLGNLKVFSKEEKIDGSRLLPEANHTSRCFINIHESHSSLCKIHVSHINVGLNQASRVHLCYPPKTISSEDVSHSGNSVWKQNRVNGWWKATLMKIDNSNGLTSLLWKWKLVAWFFQCCSEIRERVIKIDIFEGVSPKCVFH